MTCCQLLADGMPTSLQQVGEVTGKRV